MKILLKEESYRIIGSCMDVYSELGPGFSVIVYKDALMHELNLNDLYYEPEKNIMSIIRVLF